MVETVNKKGAPDPEEMARMAMERNGLYRLLAAVFREEMTAEVLSRLSAPEFQNVLEQTGVETTAFISDEAKEKQIEDLALEFSRLFFGPGNHVSAHESVHLGGDGGSLWGPQTVAVKKFIETAGYVYDSEYHGLPDHISVELEFMAHLTDQEAEAWNDRDKARALNCLHVQQLFMDRHLGCWVNPFADAVAELGKMPMYVQMAALARDFVGAEREELKQFHEFD